MNQPQFGQVDERLRAVLLGAMQRDEEVLRNADHLHALLADLAPDMPPGLRNACVAVVRTGATNWLTQTPPYSAEQVVTWLRAQYPDLTPDVAHQALAAIAQLTGAAPVPPPPAPPAPAPVPAPVPTPAPAPPPPNEPDSLPTQMPPEYVPVPHQGSWPPTPQSPPPSSGKRRRTAIILAVVAVLLIGGGVAAFFVFKGDGGTNLAAPRNVTAEMNGFGSVSVSWQPVKGADHYTIIDKTGAIKDTVVKGTSHVFAGAADANHKFVVRAVDANGDAGAASAPEPWAKQKFLPAPDGLTAELAGTGIVLSWNAVDGATDYQVRDLDDPNLTPNPVPGTTTTINRSIYSAHHFTVAAISGSTVGPTATTTWTPTHELSPAEAELAYQLTASMVDPASCRPDPDDENETDYITAAVICDPHEPGTDGPVVLYALQLNPGMQDAYETHHFGDHELKSGCDDSYPASGIQGTWHFPNGPTLGEDYCYVSNDGTNVFAWTYDDENVVIQIQGDSRSGMYAWWSPHVTLLQ